MNEWISVKNRLPKDNQKILAFNGEIHVATFNENPGEGIASIWESKSSPSGYWGLNKVTHWMPLPELPK